MLKINAMSVTSDSNVAISVVEDGRRVVPGQDANHIHLQYS